MNTIKSNLQFYERARQIFDDKICIFNSKKKDKDDKSKHAKDITNVKKFIKSGCNIIIMCAHHKRFDESIIELLNELDDSKSFNEKIIIHIDEAHEYVPLYRDKVIIMNNNDIVERIYLYSGTPFNIWVDEDEYNKGNSLYQSIYIVDIEEQFGIMKSKKYYGVKDCSHSFTMINEMELIDDVIPEEFIIRWGKDKEKNIWYGNKYPFCLGNEVKLLSFIKKSLQNMNGNRIKNDKFSYNFIPGYTRKLTHYFIMEIILSIFNNSVVIIINGDGSTVFIKDNNNNNIIKKKMKHFNEPVLQIQQCICEYPNRPVFITGFHCIGMSVTFINETIGNFDNVIFSHEQFKNNPHILYQLCRFVFNYISWTDTSKIKDTHIITYSNEIIKICLDYEKQIDLIDNNMKGSIRTKEEVIGNINVKKKKIPNEKKYSKLELYATVYKPKTFTVENNDDELILNKVKEFYKNFTGKKLKGKSLPRKDNNNFYTCSISGKNEIQTDPSKIKKWAKECVWNSNYQLVSTQKKYIRIYVVYDDIKDSLEYTWIIRRMEIQECDEVNSIWNELLK